MPFDWYSSPRRKDLARLQAERREAMYRGELEDRAGLLQRLGYSNAQARARLRAMVQWDFELAGRPRHLEAVEGIVDAIYKRKGRPGGGTPSVE